MPPLNYTVAGTLTFLHTQNKETICIVLSFDCDSVKARGSQRIFQSDTSILPCLSGLFPLSDLWYSSSSLSHRPSTFQLCELLVSLSRTHNTSKLCRGLAGVFRESLHPYFIRSSFFRSLIFYPLSLLQDHYTKTASGSQVFIRLIISFITVLSCSFRLHTLV